MKHYLSDCHQSFIMEIPNHNKVVQTICSRCGHFCNPLPASEYINELIINHSGKLTFYEHADSFGFPINSGSIGIDIKGLFLFESYITYSRENGLISTLDFSNISFTYKDSEDELILVIDEETKNVIINEVQKWL